MGRLYRESLLGLCGFDGSPERLSTSNILYRNRGEKGLTSSCRATGCGDWSADR
jgi:hypothetical protein